MIEVKNLRKKYEGNDFFSVDGISFNVEKGKLCGFLGDNGAGKTTTLKMITTIYKPDCGNIMIDGLDTGKNPIEIKRKLGVVFESSKLYENLTGEENIVFYGRLFGLDIDKIKLEAENMYKKLDIDFQHKVVSTYSKGMKQKIAITRAVITDPEVLILDEPTSGLDIVSRNLIRNYILELKECKKTVILTSHIVEDIEKLCDYVIIIQKGKIIENDTIENLINKYNMKSFEEVYIFLSSKERRSI